MNKKVTLKICFYVYIFFILLITVLRPWKGSFLFMQGTLNLTFFKEYKGMFSRNFWMFVYLFGGNIGWFVPIGFYKVFFETRSVLRTVSGGFFLSLFIEIMQYVLGRGISELDDLILNTFGVFLGWLLGKAVLGVLERKKKNLGPVS